MRIVFLTVVVGILAIAGAAFAHHGTANYNTKDSLTVKGIITAFQFINPHVLIFLDVNENGKVKKYQGELTSPNRLARVGWHQDTLKPEDTVTISGFPAKDGSPEIWIQKVILADGTQLKTEGEN
jgi:hypothetical protein